MELASGHAGAVPIVIQAHSRFTGRSVEVGRPEMTQARWNARHTVNASKGRSKLRSTPQHRRAGRVNGWTETIVPRLRGQER